MEGNISRKNGFTLIELLVTLTIVAILIAIFIPTFDEFKRRQEPLKYAQTIINAIAQARNNAMAPPVVDTTSTGHRFYGITITISSDNKSSYYQFTSAPITDDNLPDFFKIHYPDGELAKNQLPINTVFVADIEPSEIFVDKKLTLMFKVGTGEMYIYRDEGDDKFIRGYDWAKTATDPVITIYVLPSKLLNNGSIDASKISQCNNTVCAKIELNPVSAMATYSRYNP